MSVQGNYLVFEDKRYKIYDLSCDGSVQFTPRFRCLEDFLPTKTIPNPRVYFFADGLTIDIPLEITTSGAMVTKMVPPFTY